MRLVCFGVFFVCLFFILFLILELRELLFFPWRGLFLLRMWIATYCI